MCIIIKIQNKIAIIYSVIFEMGVVLISYNGKLSNIPASFASPQRRG